MNSEGIEQRPAKKRRFFQDESESDFPLKFTNVDASTSINSGLAKTPTPAEDSDADRQVEKATEITDNEPDFDIELFSSFVGCPISADVVAQLRRKAGNDMEKAVNVYLDGTWEEASDTKMPDVSQPLIDNTTEEASTNKTSAPENATHVAASHDESESGTLLPDNPEYRYLGAFGVGGWATRSSTSSLKFGEEVKIQRTKTQPQPKAGKAKRTVSNPKTDVITRFTNSNGDEIGRLPQETASWVSTLIDQKICKFTAVCVFAPERIRINDTIYLQLRCYVLNSAFKKRFSPGLEDDTHRLFDHEETAEEKALRLRQVALVTLFDEICLSPTSGDETTAKQKKSGLLRAAEMAEQGTKSGTLSKDPSKDADEESENDDGEHLDQDQLDTLYQKAQCFDFSMPEATPGETFNLELRKYQKQALHWLITKEKDEKSTKQRSMHPLWEEYPWPVKDVDDKPLPRVRGKDFFYVNPYSGELSLDFPVQEQNCLGGILADEMGLGKTIEMMSLIHSHKPNSEYFNSITSSSSSQGIIWPHNSPEVSYAPHTTLVVAPTSLLSQWESEASKASKPGTMKTLVYYGTDKSVNLRNICSPKNQLAPNIIITSYGVVRSEHSQILSGRTSLGDNGLFSVEYFRVILDEAHYIKNRASKTAKACYEIKAKHRWVLTGTPIVNRLEDLYSLVRFLKVEPWCNFSFWKTFITVPFESKDFTRALSVVQTVLEPLVLRRTKTMKTPEGEALVPLPSRTITVEEIELSEQEREIYDVIFTRAKRTFNDNVAAGTLLKSYTTIFAQILRLRQTCCHPILTRNQSIVAEEEDAAIAADEMNILKDNMDLQELIDKFASSMQASDSEERDPTANFTTHALKQIQAESSGECPICSEEPMINPAVTSCWHSACKACLESYIKHQTDKGEVPRCFCCREKLSSRDIFEVVRHESPEQTPTTQNPPSLNNPAPSACRISLRRINPLSPSAKTSAKIHALITHLTRLPRGTKAVVFSQFTSFLDLISPQLTTAGIAHLRFDGTMSQKARATVLAQFNAPIIDEEDIDDDDDIANSPDPFKGYRSRPRKDKGPPPSVLLISLRAGGVGLNLTVANHVFMMDPWWSFAVEAQAIDRVHRMGQLRDVKVSRFVVKNSIEGRILKIQERKMMIAGSLGLRVGGDGSDEDKREQRIEELKLLFE
ncbi:DNA excision repair protein (Rad5) [Trichophyton interdigitale]|uniref:DNA excision repair protein (Rad5) n=1 Tax=Trichophyton interdigitale TaxID=101480 RepID=A0A9P4YKG2_9EURO|nr:DNA excision repair protein (Rad5) [Trichophyton interdigitale]KAF3899816.1 DNA excision repair protein (Rad5) [Trichophyton interdigitale]KAG8209731.1 DNA excision repair protein (Rad5) [Trichophyton interdigitale]